MKFFESIEDLFYLMYDSIEDLFYLMYDNYQIALPFLIIGILFVALYVYHFRKPIEIRRNAEIPSHWGACDPIYRLVEYLSALAQNRKRQKEFKMKVTIQTGHEICYADLMNPFKYVMPRIRPASSAHQSF